MKNLDDEAQMTDRERAFTDKQKIRQTAKCGDTSGKVTDYPPPPGDVLFQVNERVERKAQPV